MGGGGGLKPCSSFKIIKKCPFQTNSNYIVDIKQNAF